MATTSSALKIPKSLAECADLYYKTREDRLVIQRQADALEESEKLLKEHLIDNIPKSNATGIAGKLCRVAIVTSAEPQVYDWDATWAHIAKTRAKGGFALLNKAINKAAIKEIWAAGKEVPGVGVFNVVKLSINKL